MARGALGTCALRASNVTPVCAGDCAVRRCRQLVLLLRAQLKQGHEGLVEFIATIKLRVHDGIESHQKSIKIHGRTRANTQFSRILKNEG